MQHTMKRYTGNWPRISMILAELSAATWLRGHVHRITRRNGEWLLIVSYRQA